MGGQSRWRIFLTSVLASAMIGSAPLAAATAGAAGDLMAGVAAGSTAGAGSTVGAASVADSAAATATMAGVTTAAPAMVGVGVADGVDTGTVGAVTVVVGTAGGAVGAGALGSSQRHCLFYYDTYWWDGVPYYYADDVYYQWNGDAGAYETVQPPSGLANEVAAQQPAVRDLYMYPKSGQTAEQQGEDRAACHKWAATQPDSIPTMPLPRWVASRPGRAVRVAQAASPRTRPPSASTFSVRNGHASKHATSVE